MKALWSCLPVLLLTGAALAADTTYPFEGSWARADRSCVANSTRERTYTAKEVISSRGRCTIRRVASNGSSYELFERCERPNEKNTSVRETIRMLAPDTMTLTRQTSRLKLSRTLRFSRCPSIPAAPAKG